jgi:hypothetical protein
MLEISLVAETRGALPDVCVAIKSISQTQQHVGVIYRAEGEEHALLHLKFHDKLERDELEFLSYYWIKPSIDPRNLQLLAEWLAVIWARNKNKGLLPFSIEYSGRYFASDATFSRTGVGEGLTCATFILSVFSDFGLSLVDGASWPKRVGDEKWQKQILDVLEKEATAEHVKAQKKHIGVASRFRPEEVAGATGIYSGTPVLFNQAEKAGKTVLQSLRAASNSN